MSFADGIFTTNYHDLEDGGQYERIEDAVLTNCPVCGERLEWKIDVLYDQYSNAPILFGEAFSCGLKFTISRDRHDGYYYTAILRN